MARKYNAFVESGHTILVIDDNREVLESTRHLLEAEGHRVLTAEDGPTGIDVVRCEHPHVILCDYFMPRMTGEEVVRLIRANDQLAQIILQTGYSGEKPARVMMRDLDIQGYHDKGEGAERLLLWVDSALKAYRSAIAAEKHRIGLQYILDITPELHRLRPVDELLQGLLWQVEGLVGAENSFLATFSSEDISNLATAGHDLEGFVAIPDAQSLQSQLEIRVGTGRFRSGISTDALPDPERGLIAEAIRSGGISFVGDVSVLPLRLGTAVLGAIFIDRRPGYPRDRDLLEIFARQAATAIQSALLYGQNAMLYDLATRDPITGLYLRGYTMQQLHQHLKRCHRNGMPLSLLMVDMDKFKLVNDTHGHIAGDAALAAVGALLQGTVRETDCVGRFGGDEFIVLLPDTPIPGLRVVAERILERARELSIAAPDGRVPLRLSIGGATLLPSLPAGNCTPYHRLHGNAIEKVATDLIHRADGALYAAKGTGLFGEVRTLSWGSALLATAT